MTHSSEFDTSAKAREEREAKRIADARIMAATYARVFCTDDGRAVLEDLRKKFGHDRPRFDRRRDNHSTVTAAIIDGECAVLREIEQAIKAGRGS